MDCCLGPNGCTIGVQSVLSIFFSWIPQTDLEVKFLNDLEIILDSVENMQMISQMPELYDFMLELCYKALVFEEMEEKRIYIEKLEGIYKSICEFIFREDPDATGKFSFIASWAHSKGDEYHPKCLFLTCRYMLLLLLESIEEYLVMNNNNQKIMERNFQSLGTTVQAFLTFRPAGEQGGDFLFDDFDRVVFSEHFEVTPLLAPYFRSRWADSLICEKYMFLFKKFFCTDWYLRGVKSLPEIEADWLRRCLEDQDLSREAAYYLKNNFLTSIIEISQALLVEAVSKSRSLNVE